MNSGSIAGDCSVYVRTTGIPASQILFHVIVVKSLLLLTSPAGTVLITVNPEGIFSTIFPIIDLVAVTVIVVVSCFSEYERVTNDLCTSIISGCSRT